MAAQTRWHGCGMTRRYLPSDSTLPRLNVCQPERCPEYTPDRCFNSVIRRNTTLPAGLPVAVHPVGRGRCKCAVSRRWRSRKMRLCLQEAVPSEITGGVFFFGGGGGGGLSLSGGGTG